MKTGVRRLLPVEPGDEHGLAENVAVHCVEHRCGRGGRAGASEKDHPLTSTPR